MFRDLIDLLWRLVVTPLLSAVLLTLIAGVANGSFALPTKYVTSWNFENIWLNYSFWAFLILPWATILILDPHVFSVYRLAPSYLIVLIMAGGFLFGIGQICFAQALNMIGLGLGFAINIGLATGLGFLLPLLTLHRAQLFTDVGLATLLGLVFIIIGLVLSFIAGQRRDQRMKILNAASSKPQSRYALGIFLAILAGLCSAEQNFTFALTSHLPKLAMVTGIDSLASAIIIWPPFMTCCFIPYAIYMLIKHSKNNSFWLYREPGTLSNLLLCVVMAILWFGSLILYSKSAQLIGKLGPIIAWPLFMVLTILTSHFWGWRHHEWAGYKASIKRLALFSMSSLVIAVIILAYSATLG